MRYFLPYCLLALAGFQFGARLLLPLAQLEIAHARAAIRLSSEETDQNQTFILLRIDFANGRSGQREWWHAGQLYDLKKVVIQGDSVRVTAFPDAHEQWLLAGFQRLFGANTGTVPGANPLTRLLVQFLAQPFLCIDHGWALSPPAHCFTRPLFFFQVRDLLGFARIFDPPPDDASACA